MSRIYTGLDINSPDVRDLHIAADTIEELQPYLLLDLLDIPGREGREICSAAAALEKEPPRAKERTK